MIRSWLHAEYSRQGSEFTKISIFLFILLLALGAAGCGNSKEKAGGDGKSTASAEKSIEYLDHTYKVKIPAEQIVQKLGIFHRFHASRNDDLFGRDLHLVCMIEVLDALLS